MSEVPLQSAPASSRGQAAMISPRLIYSCITQLKAQGPFRSSNESKEEEEDIPDPGQEQPVRHGQAVRLRTRCHTGSPRP